MLFTLGLLIGVALTCCLLEINAMLHHERNQREYEMPDRSIIIMQREDHFPYLDNVIHVITPEERDG